MRQSKYTNTYTAVTDGTLQHYVRLVPQETPQLPHGLSLATPFESNFEASRFADLVDAYLEQAFGLSGQT